MPKVGDAHYEYTPAGRAAAKAASKKSGKPMEVDPKKAGKKPPPFMKKGK